MIPPEKKKKKKMRSYFDRRSDKSGGITSTRLQVEVGESYLSKVNLVILVIYTLYIYLEL